jgi:TonB family protein
MVTFGNVINHSIQMKTTIRLTSVLLLFIIGLAANAQDAKTELAQLQLSLPDLMQPEEPSVPDLKLLTKDAHFSSGAGYTNLNAWLGQRLEYPDEARVLGVSGVVKVAFDILPDGTLSNMDVVESPLDLFSDQVMVAMQSMPLWSPAYRDGIPVTSRQEVHVTFRLP